MKFASLDEAQSAYDELVSEVQGLKDEKAALLRKRDELLGELKTTRQRFSKFADYADRDDIDIAALLEIKQKFESGTSEAKTQYEQAYQADKAKFEQRLAAMEAERAAEKAEREQEKAEAAAAKLKAAAISELSKESLRIRNPEQFWILYGSKIQLSDDGKLIVGDEYKSVSIAEYVASIEASEDNQHHFKPKGGSGSGATSTNGASNGKAKVPNPWAEGSVNLTQQGQLLLRDPQLALRLMAEAGVDSSKYVK